MTPLQFDTAIGVFFRVLALAILHGYVLGRAWHESRITDGIGFLRKVIYISLLMFTLTNDVVLLTNLGRVLGLLREDLIGGISIINGFAQLFLAVALYLIYSREYGNEKR